MAEVIEHEFDGVKYVELTVYNESVNLNNQAAAASLTDAGLIEAQTAISAALEDRVKGTEDLYNVKEKLLEASDKQLKAEKEKNRLLLTKLATANEKLITVKRKWMEEKQLLEKRLKGEENNNS